MLKFRKFIKIGDQRYRILGTSGRKFFLLLTALPNTEYFQAQYGFWI